MAMDSRVSSVSLEKYINSLDPFQLPRIVEVTEGVYDEGSLYDFSTTAGTLSTGDVIKITGISLLRVLATLCDSNMKAIPNSEVKIPANYSGLFESVSHHNQVRSKHPTSSLTSHSELKKITLTEVLQQKLSVVTPSNDPNNMVPPIPGLPFDYENVLLINPVYTVKGVLQQTGRKIKVLSTLDVEVTDITGICNMEFKMDRACYSLNDLFAMSEDFPLAVEVCESCSANLSFRQSYVACEVGTKLWMHAARVTTKYIVTHTVSAKRGQEETKHSQEQKQHFLVPLEYTGQFRRLPQKFRCLYDIDLKAAAVANMQFMATRSWESDNPGLSSIDVGDRFEALECITKRIGGREIKALKAESLLDNTTVLLADYSIGDFLEIVQKKSAPMSIKQVVAVATLPCQMKLVTGDGMPGDPLMSIQGTLVLENQTVDRCLVASITSGPDHYTFSPFEIPIDRVSMALWMYPYSKATTTVAIDEVVNVERLSAQTYNSLLMYDNPTFHTQPPPIPCRQPTVKEQKKESKKATKKAGNVCPRDRSTCSPQSTQTPLEDKELTCSDIHDYETIDDEDLIAVKAIFAFGNTYSNV